MDQTQAFLTLLLNPEGWGNQSYQQAFLDAYYAGDTAAVCMLDELANSISKARDEVLRLTESL